MREAGVGKGWGGDGPWGNARDGGVMVSGGAAQLGSPNNSVVAAFEGTQRQERGASGGARGKQTPPAQRPAHLSRRFALATTLRAPARGPVPTGMLALTTLCGGPTREDDDWTATRLQRQPAQKRSPKRVLYHPIPLPTPHQGGGAVTLIDTCSSSTGPLLGAQHEGVGAATKPPGTLGGDRRQGGVQHRSRVSASRKERFTAQLPAGMWAVEAWSRVSSRETLCAQSWINGMGTRVSSSRLPKLCSAANEW